MKARLTKLPKLNIPCKIVEDSGRAYIMINTYDVAKLIEKRMVRRLRDVKYNVYVLNEYIVIEVAKG